MVDPSQNAREVYAIGVRGRTEFTIEGSRRGGSLDRCELDSHADTHVGGANCVLMSRTGEYATVHSFSNERKPFQDVPIGTVATSWVNPETGETFVLMFPETLFFGDRLDHSLLCPNQMRAYGITVSDAPRQFDQQSSHSIFVPEDNVSIPLDLEGIISGFASHRPTEDELVNCRRLFLGSDDPWNPNDPDFAQQETVALQRSEIAGVHRDGDDNDVVVVDGDVDAIADDDFVLSKRFDVLPAPPELFDEADLVQRFVAAVNIPGDDWSGDGLNGYGDTDLFRDCNERREVFALSSDEKRSVVTKEALAQRWGIGLNTAHRTLRATTQRGIRTFVNPTDRRVSTHKPHLVFPTMRGTKFYTDTMFAKVKSVSQNVCSQVWTDGHGYSRFYPLRSKKDAWTTVAAFTHDLQGIPEVIVSDGAGEQTGGSFKGEIRKLRAKHHLIEPYSPWQNRAELEIQQLKRGIKRATKRARSPKRLWDYCGKWVTAIRRMTAHDDPGLDGLTPEESVHARVTDISAYAQFDWYQPVWYIDKSKDTADSPRRLGRWIGVSEGVGTPMTYMVLPKSCRPIPRTSVFPLSEDDRLSASIAAELAELDESIRSKIGDHRSDEECLEEFPDVPEIAEDIFDDDLPTTEPAEGETGMPEADEFYSPEAFDQYLTAEVLLDRGGESKLGIVKSRKRDAEGNPVGRSHTNPLLDSREYEVEFPDGSVDVLTANAIAEALYSQVDEEGRSYSVFSEIVDHRKDGNAVAADDAFIPGTNRRRRTTKGWQLLVESKHGTVDWLPLSDLKESYPIKVAEYAVNNKIASEPAFAWWVPYVLKKRDRVIKRVQKRYWKRSHKFGIELPKSVEHALEIDRHTGTDFWRKAIEKEMRNVQVAFDIREDGTIPVGFKEIRCHFVFDIKSDSLARKARFVAQGNMTEPPKESTYSSVVSRDSVRLFFLLAALNDLDVRACDIQNAYLNAMTSEKVWFRGGKEMGPDAGKVVVIVRALYGLRSAGKSFRQHLAQTLDRAGFKSSRADPDIWMRKAVKPDGTKFYEYVLAYVDDVVYEGLEADKFMDYLRSVYTLKDGSVKEPDYYLGADVRIHELASGEKAWALSSDTYVKRAIEEVERELSYVGKQLKKKVTSPFASNYRPELDATPELDEKRASYYASLMGVLRWCIELGRIDIIVEVGLLARFQACPREGHLDQLFHVFAYLKKYNHSTLVFDWTEPELSEEGFVEVDWQDYYPGAVEAIPSNMPEPRGKEVLTTCFVDADHAGCRLTRRSHSGVLIFVNRAPIIWFSKRQATVESSTFGSESVAMRQAIDLIEGLRYKLRMMGVPIDGSTKMYCDNESVVKATSRPESTLKKKHNVINYHRAREAQAAGHVRVAWIDGKENLADALTKVTVGERRRYLFSRILW